MEFSRLTLQVLSGQLAIIPIVIGLRALSANRKLAGTLVIFLLIGMATDVTMGALVRSDNIPLATRVFQFYSLFESLIFLWVIHQLSDVAHIQRAARFAALGLPFFWLMCVFALPMVAEGNRGSAIYDSTYEVIVAFLAGLSILARVEKDTRLVRQAGFWLMFAIFFYCFGTFFIMFFLKTLLAIHIWFINNIVNVLTYGLYSIGLARLRLSER